MTAQPADQPPNNEGVGNGGQLLARRPARSLEAAAIAGVVYAVLALSGLALLLRVPDLGLTDAEMSAWYADGGHQRSLILGLNLVSISSIAMLWFVAVLRRRLGDREDRFFGTVFYGSAIAFVVVWMAAAAMVAAPAVAMNLVDDASVSRASASLSAGLGASLLLVAAPRLQAVFILAVSNLVIRSGFLPRWVGHVGFVVGLAMLVIPLIAEPIGLAFPLWVFLVSIVILLNRPTTADQAEFDDDDGGESS